MALRTVDNKERVKSVDETFMFVIVYKGAVIDLLYQSNCEIDNVIRLSS